MVSNSEILIYQTDDGYTKIEVRMDNETVWLTQLQMAELFQTTKQNISLHINNIFKEGELEQSSTVKELLTVQNEGVRSVTRNTNYYNLDVIISVGYRVKSLRGTQFRKWALQVLKEYLIKGFSMNDDLLKNAGGGTYWNELLQRIRDIRVSEKVFYRQVLDIYATSIDYDPKAEQSILFFKTVQNKLHYATHNQTASEVIFSRVSADKPFIGLKSFKGSKPTRSDIKIAKNYLDENELAILQRIVAAFFELAELKAMRHEPMYMKDWLKEVDDFAERYGQGVLENAGSVSHQQAIDKANKEYDKYNVATADELTNIDRTYLDTINVAEKELHKKGIK